MTALYLFIVIMGGQRYVLDTNQTLADCGNDISQGVSSITLDEAHTMPVAGNATYVCEVQE